MASAAADMCAPSERHQFTHQGRLIYEWDQAFSEVNVYVEVPPGTRAKELYCDIQAAGLKLGLHPLGAPQPNPPYIQVGQRCATRARGDRVDGASPRTSTANGACCTTRVACRESSLIQSSPKNPSGRSVSGGRSLRGASASPVPLLALTDRCCTRHGTASSADGSQLTINLQKAERGEPWPSVFKGHELDAMAQQQESQRLMLERFQQEVRSSCAGAAVGGGSTQHVLRPCARHCSGAPPVAQHPGFDFSGATFNGQVPNPRTFMGGTNIG